MAIEEHVIQESDARDPVRHRVVDARRYGFPPVRQPADHVERPQRTAAVEVLGHTRTDDAPRGWLASRSEADAGVIVGGRSESS